MCGATLQHQVAGGGRDTHRGASKKRWMKLGAIPYPLGVGKGDPQQFDDRRHLGTMLL